MASRKTKDLEAKGSKHSLRSIFSDVLVHIILTCSIVPKYLNTATFSTLYADSVLHSVDGTYILT